MATITPPQEGFGRLLDYGKELDRHYIGSRYPNFYGIGLPLEPVGYTLEEFRRMRREGNRFVREVLYGEI